MSDDPSTRFSLKRWSQRKLEASRAAREPLPLPASAQAASSAPSAAVVEPAAAEVAPELALPPVESLGFESDFAAFMQPKVAEGLRRQALKKLFRDPRFNVMDGLDVYIDDYSIPSPVTPELIREMLHARNALDPPKTRVNAQGWVEDVPPEELEAAAAPVAPPMQAGEHSSLTPPQESASPHESAPPAVGAAEPADPAEPNEPLARGGAPDPDRNAS